jgi:hypothetical protein
VLLGRRKYNRAMSTSYAYAPGQALQKILDGYSRGLCGDKLQTLDLISKLRGRLSDSETVELRTALRHIFEVSDTASRNERGYTINMATLTLSSLAEFCSLQDLLQLVFSRFPIGDDAKIEIWARELVPELQWNVIRFPARLDADALHRIKANATLVRASTHIYPPLAVSALEQLERTAELVEFQKFAKSLSKGAISTGTIGISLEDATPETTLSPTVASALEEAAQRLQSEGEFDTKTAADLIRSAMEEAHREFVAQLGSVKGKPYGGEDKDGARRYYMREVGFITQSEETFFSAIYSLISREASHRLIAPRETVLLLHQTVQGYLLLLAERLRKQET